MITWLEKINISDLKIFIGNSGIYDTLTDAKIFSKDQIESAINSAVEQYIFLMPCACGKKFHEKYKNLALSHISIIFVFNVYKNASAEQNDTKSRIERDYNSLINEFKEGGIFNRFCEKLNEIDEDALIPSFNISMHGTYNPIGINDTFNRRI